MKPETKAVDIDRNIGDFYYDVAYAKDAGRGLTERIENISGEAIANSLGEQGFGDDRF